MVKRYETADYYFSTDGRLAAIKVTKPIAGNCLAEALNAYKKAHEVDAKAKKTKDIVNGIQNVNARYIEEAYTSYTLGNMKDASKFFEYAAKAAAVAPNSQIDTNSIYNAGLTAWFLANEKDSLEANKWLERAKKFYEEALSYKYYGEDGEVFAKLADIADKLGDKALSKDYLEKGFSAFPNSQSILVGLINYYVSSGDNPQRIFKLLDLAKENEPNNASLYYVEGNIHDKLGDEAEALAAYDKCAEINPEYEYGYIGKGILLYNKALNLQEAASKEMDDAKYMALVKDFEIALKDCIEPFEKAYEVSKDQSIKVSIAEYLKNACFRFRADAEYLAKYQKYNQVVAEGK
jgi:tetratricopeptide (TPR) repeat protein